MITLRFIFFIFIVSSFANAETLEIEFSDYDAYSIEVARIGIGDTIKWIPKNKGHNVEFLSGPKLSLLPRPSEIDEVYSVVFDVPGIYLYGCTPHRNMGMLGLIVVGNNFDNLNEIKSVKLSRIASSVLNRLLKIAQEKS
tara:strand:+ start:142 stop:561 length:420 start_codon:yes stop_codon:yes gene_type:complete